jgi:hypothetical protein
MKLQSMVCKVASHFSSKQQVLQKRDHLPASGAEVNHYIELYPHFSVLPHVSVHMGTVLYLR